MNRGFTIIESMVALIILSLSAGGIWNLIQTSHNAYVNNYMHHRATSLATNEIETLRTRDRRGILDSLYSVELPKGRKVWVVRDVMDSIQLVEQLDEIILDSEMNPVAWKKPLEVSISVWLPHEDWVEGQPLVGRKLTQISILMPEYRWY